MHGVPRTTSRRLTWRHNHVGPGLEGHLLLICGDSDSAAFPALTLQLADSLIETNKSFDMLYLPNQTHMYFVSQPYVMRWVWDYFVKHLLGATPPKSCDMKPYGSLIFQPEVFMRFRREGDEAPISLYSFGYA